MIKITTTVDKETLDLMRKYSKETGIPQAEIIRRSVREYLTTRITKTKKEGER